MKLISIHIEILEILNPMNKKIAKCKIYLSLEIET